MPAVSYGEFMRPRTVGRWSFSRSLVMAACTGDERCAGSAASMRDIRAFLFDIGNVIVRFDFSKALREVASLSDVTNETMVLARIDEIKMDYEDGQLPRADFLKSAFHLLRYRGTEAQFINA